MIGSRRLLLIGVIVGSVLLLGVLATVLSGVGRNPERKACDQLIEYVIKQDDIKSYNLFTDSAKKSTSADDWSAKVVGLAPGYLNAKMTYLNTIPVEAHDDDPEKSSRSELLYTVANPSTTTDVSCGTYNDGKRTAVDSFISKAQE